MSVGDNEDKRMCIWEVRNGSAVSSAPIAPDLTRDVAWGGKVKGQRESQRERHTQGRTEGG